MTYFMSEISSNHARDIERALKFIDVSSDIGCNAVKFQLFKIDELFAPEILKKSENHRSRKEWELPVSFLPELKKRCIDKKIDFSCTPFYLKAVEELYPFVDFYKIASYELLWDDLLAECARTEKPVVLSTGMATVDEVKKAFDVLYKNNCSDITILHCVSSYPVPAADCNLKAIETIRKITGMKTGWSDHSVNPAVIYRAVHKYNSDIIEFHLDLEGKGAEYKAGHCWLPEDIGKIIKDIKDGFKSDGNGEKKPVASELPDIEWRADPSDGLRPFKNIRQSFNENYKHEIRQ